MWFFLFLLSYPALFSTMFFPSTVFAFMTQTSTTSTLSAHDAPAAASTAAPTAGRGASSSPSEIPLPPGLVLGALLGSGGFGKVFQGTLQVDPDRPVASAVGGVLGAAGRQSRRWRSSQAPQAWSSEQPPITVGNGKGGSCKGRSSRSFRRTKQYPDEEAHAQYDLAESSPRRRGGVDVAVKTIKEEHSARVATGAPANEDGDQCVAVERPASAGAIPRWAGGPANPLRTDLRNEVPSLTTEAALHEHITNVGVDSRHPGKDHIVLLLKFWTAEECSSSAHFYDAADHHDAGWTRSPPPRRDEIFHDQPPTISPPPHIPLLALELCDLGNLRDFLKHTGGTRPLFHVDADCATAFGRMIFSALHFLHSEACIVHRDVKPSNIFLHRKKPGSRSFLEEGVFWRGGALPQRTQIGTTPSALEDHFVLKLGDFGLARAQQEPLLRRGFKRLNTNIPGLPEPKEEWTSGGGRTRHKVYLTMLSGRGYTWGYGAPEVRLCQSVGSEAADVFSAGLCFLDLVCEGIYARLLNQWGPDMWRTQTRAKRHEG